MLLLGNQLFWWLGQLNQSHNVSIFSEGADSNMSRPFVRGLMIVFMRIRWFLTPKECFKDHLFKRAYIVHASPKRCNFVDRAEGTSEAIISGQALLPHSRWTPTHEVHFFRPSFHFTVEPLRLSQPMSCLQGYFAIYVLGRLFGPPNPKTDYFPGLESVQKLEKMVTTTWKYIDHMIYIKRKWCL